MDLQINNSLIVKSSSTLEGDVTLSGGLNAGEFEYVEVRSLPLLLLMIKVTLMLVDLFTKTVIGQFVDTDASSMVVLLMLLVDLLLMTNTITFSTPSNTTIFEVGAYLLLDRSRLAIFDPTAFTANVAAAAALSPVLLTLLVRHKQYLGTY